VLLQGVHQFWDGVQLGVREDGWLRGDTSDAKRGPFKFSGQVEWPVPEEEGLEGRGLSVTRPPRTSLRRGAESAQVHDFEREAPTAHPEVKKVKGMVQSIHHRRCQALYHYLMGSVNKFSEGQWLRNSVFRGSGQWLAGPGGWLYGHYGIRDADEYRAALRQRVLLSRCMLPVSVSSEVAAAVLLPAIVRQRCCPLCEMEGWKADLPFHYLHCSQQQAFVKFRHNRARDLLADYVRRDMLSGGGLVDVEQTVVVPAVQGQQQPQLGLAQQEEHPVLQDQDHPLVQDPQQQPPQPTGQVRRGRGLRVPPRADIVIAGADGRSVDGVRFIDVAIVDVTSPSYRVRNEPRYASLDPRILASKIREDQKFWRYRDVDGVNCPEFLPFVVEATGQFGPAAGKWLKTYWDRLHREEKFVSRFIFISQMMGGLIARTNAKMALAWARATVRQATT
jgi:hypothetical protein